MEIDFIVQNLKLYQRLKARSLGFDRSMVASYGQDDRVCAYALLESLLESEESSVTKVAIFADKEEIGSVGNTGMCSESFDYFMNKILNL